MVVIVRMAATMVMTVRVAGMGAVIMRMSVHYGRISHLGGITRVPFRSARLIAPTAAVQRPGQRIEETPVAEGPIYLLRRISIVAAIRRRRGAFAADP